VPDAQLLEELASDLERAFGDVRQTVEIAAMRERAGIIAGLRDADLPMPAAELDEGRVF
jgi:hypothetical protein